MVQQEVTTQIVERPDGSKSVVITKSDGSVERINVAPDGQVQTGATAGAPVATVAPEAPSSRRKALPDGLVDMMAIIMGAVTLTSLGTPLIKAWARRFERRHEVQQNAQIEQRLAAIEQAIETVAVEVERISEGQRFTTKLLSERAPAEMERVR